MSVAEPLLPTSVLADLADANKREVVFPPGGRWAVGDNVRLTRPNVRVRGEGCTLVSDNGRYPFQAISTLITRPNAHNEWHATGAVTPSTDTLALAEPVPFLAGETVLVRMGVSSHDPAEPEAQVYVTIAEVTATSIKFTSPLLRSPKVWASFNDLIVAIGVDQNQGYKTGPWEHRSGYYARGLGTDHGIQGFVGGQPVGGITVEGLTVEFPYLSTFPYGGWAFSAVRCRDVRFIDCTTVDPCGHSFHCFASDNMRVINATVRGRGRSLDYQSNVNFGPSAVLSAWGGNGLRLSGASVDGSDFSLVGLEAGTTGTVVEDVSFRSWWSRAPSQGGNMNGGQIFNAAGLHPGLLFRDIRLTVPKPALGYGALLVQSQTLAGTRFEDIAFESGELPDFLELSRFKWDGTIRVGSQVFGPARTVGIEYTINYPYTKLLIPAGLYRSAGLTILSGGPNIRDINIGGPTSPSWSQVVGASNPSQITFPNWRQNSPGPVRLPSQIDCGIYMHSGTARVRFEAELFPL